MNLKMNGRVLMLILLVVWLAAGYISFYIPGIAGFMLGSVTSTFLFASGITIMLQERGLMDKLVPQKVKVQMQTTEQHLREKGR